jgi:cytoskeletal protein CcmA (bactofilin family)
MWRRKRRPRMWGRLGGFLDDGSEIEGKYTCTGTVMLDAAVRGEITSTDTLIIGDRGVVHATVHAVTLVVRGELVGEVTASERVELKSSARVTGDIVTPLMIMEQGAVLDGQCRMTKARPVEVQLSVVVPIKG